MEKKFLIVGSKPDRASRNIIMNLMDLDRGFDYHIIDGDMTKTENLDLEKISRYDFVIFASKHKSEKSEKTLSIHAPGNFREVWGGGISGKLSMSSSLFQKHLFGVLKTEVEKAKLTKYKITLECTHHGPLIETPCVFIEIGGSETEWKDRAASFVIAKTIRESIKTYAESPYLETAIGIGGPHYCPTFNKIQLNSNVAISHVIPKYVAPITREMILEAIEKTEEEVDFAVIDWKGLGKAEERQIVLDILEDNYIIWKRSGEIGK